MKNNARLVEFAGESNTGLLRHSNEDHFLVCQLHGTEMALAVVSDGIGGHSKGEIASMICCRELFHAALELKSDVDAGEFFRRQLLAVNRKLFERNYREARRRPMGCTAVAALFDRDKITVASVGDSRFYKYSVPDGTLTQITRDHRPDEAMLENIAALYHQDKEELRSRLLLNALGTKYAPEVDIFHHRNPDAAELPFARGAIFDFDFGGIEFTGVTHRSALGIAQNLCRNRQQSEKQTVQYG